MRSIVLLAALLAIGNSCVNGAVLVRFINTVPARTTGTTVSTTNGHITVQSSIDRIGLQYSSAGQAPAEVWTEALNRKAADATTSPYSYQYAMPPLRQYHNTDTGVANPVTAVDTVAAWRNEGLSARCNTDQCFASDDMYTQSYLKADGVGLYLQFAAGSYTFQAYAALATGDTATDRTSPARPITTSVKTLVFEDGKVYSIIATGAGQFAATPVLTGNTVTLNLLEESVSPVTFGMASLRWFHAIRSQSAATINVYNAATTTDPIASGIAFAAASSYVDVVPNQQQNFPITASSSTATVITSTTNAATHTIHAGLRATIICAQQDETVANVFCRLIPSRVVAYVRLVNDLAGQQSQVQGPFGGQALNTVKLTLWASYELPLPSQVVEGSQHIGMSTVPRIATLARGLYGVVSNVAAGGCSGYGEVFVPVIIMDYAVRSIITRDLVTENPDLAAAVSGAAPIVVAGQYYAGPVDNSNNNLKSPIGAAHFSWFIGAPIHKRVSFVVKTDGFATISGRAGADFATTEATVARIPGAAAVAGSWLQGSLLLSQYIEPGQFYSLIVTPGTSVGGVTVGTTYTPSQVQVALTTTVGFHWRLDRSIAIVSSQSNIKTTGKTNVNFIPFGQQDFAGGVTLRKKDSSNVAVTGTIPANAAATTLSFPVVTAGTQWNTPTVLVSVDAGSFSFEHTPTTAQSCLNKLPNGEINAAAGDIYDIFLLNSFGCLINNNPNVLTVSVCKTQSALDTAHAVNTLLDGTVAAPPAAPGFLLASASTASSSLALLFAAIIAIVAALL